MHVDPIRLIATIVLIGVFIYIRWKRKKDAPGAAKKTKPTTATSPVPIRRDRVAKAPAAPGPEFAELRRQALATQSDSLGLSGPLGDNEPYGALMEMALPSVVTLACFINGEASLYYESGGGMIGGISYGAVRKVAKEFVAAAGRALPLMSLTTEHPLPGADKVRFYVLTQRGTHTVETDRQALGEPNSELGALYYNGQTVVTQMRQVQEQKTR